MLDSVLRINGRKDKIDISVSQSYHVGKNSNSLYQKQINMKEKSRKGKTIKMRGGEHLKTVEKIHVFLFFKCSKISGINMLYEMNVKHIEYYFKQKWQCSF